ncbi:hypothetical protein E1B28_006589 [Marasmius oreades]|uniref:Uncharacterized protein n=1 Tax=Marasmius oreades TaxID=181124 RepID=A0A9P7UWF5_9AGAR|nr:uncharacterized protein E1B28_006589 [Marasmius oreades]KAG7095902.1 hypothetical protein E1B28_006589 [Marasmius oreades]
MLKEWIVGSVGALETDLEGDGVIFEASVDSPEAKPASSNETHRVDVDPKMDPLGQSVEVAVGGWRCEE